MHQNIRHVAQDKYLQNSDWAVRQTIDDTKRKKKDQRRYKKLTMDDTKIHLTSLGIMGVPNCRSPAQTPQYHGECSDAQGDSGESPIAPADAPVSFSSSRTCPHSIAGCINPPLFTSQINAMRCSGTVEYIYIYALHISIHICISGQETII